MSLAEFAAGYDTDKGTVHAYFELYATLLNRHRRSALRVLEIGVFRGGSLSLWVDWFADSTEVHGIDVRPIEVPGAKVHEANAYDLATVRALPGKWDVIIDDGPHTLESQIFTCTHWARTLSPRGTLVIEDIPDPEWGPELVAALPEELRRFASIVDRRHAGQPDDVLLVVDIAP